MCLLPKLSRTKISESFSVNPHFMKNLKVVFAIALLASSGHLLAQSTTATDKVRHRVVFQVTTGDSLAWRGMLNNIQHLKEGWGDAIQIEVVAHGAGIDLVVAPKTNQQKRIGAFIKEGVTFVGCENSIRLRKIDKKDILPGVGFVPMGVGELILKQEQGWAYLKAGN